VSATKSKSERELLLYNYIKQELSEYPDFLKTVISSITAGISEKIDNLNKKINDLDIAFLSALNLCQKERISRETIRYLNNLVIEKIKKSKDSMCAAERDFIEKTQQTGVRK
jgi:hypothetical protein